MPHEPSHLETPGQNPVELLQKLGTLDTDQKRNNYLRSVFIDPADVDQFLADMDADEELDLSKKQITKFKGMLESFKVYLNEEYLPQTGERVQRFDEKLKEVTAAFGNPEAKPEELEGIGKTRRRVAQALQVAKAPRGAKGKSLREVTQKGASSSPEKVLDPEQKTSFLSKLETDFAANPKRHEGIQLADIKKALDAASEAVLYGLYKMEQNGHEVRVVRAKEGSKKGFRFDSCSQESPAGKRDIDYPEAAKIAKEWGIDLMDPKVFDEMRIKYKLDRSTWDHLKTDEKTLESGLSFYGDGNGIRRDSADGHRHDGGFRGSLWVSEA